MRPCFRAFVFLLPLYAPESSLSHRGIFLTLTARRAVQQQGCDIRSKVPNCLDLVATLGELYPCLWGARPRERGALLALLACLLRAAS